MIKSSYNALCTLGTHFYWLGGKGSGFSKAGVKSHDCTSFIYGSFSLGILYSLLHS